MIDAFDFRNTRIYPGSDNNLGKILLRKVVRIHFFAQMQMHTRQVDLPTEIAQSFVKFFFAGNGFRHIELPADLVCSFKKMHLVTAPRQNSRSS